VPMQLCTVRRHGSETAAAAKEDGGEAGERRRGRVDAAKPKERDRLDREHRGEGSLATDAVGYPAPEETPDGVENGHDAEQRRDVRRRQAGEVREDDDGVRDECDPSNHVGKEL
jgi:hypothetical protein